MVASYSSWTQLPAPVQGWEDATGVPVASGVRVAIYKGKVVDHIMVRLVAQVIGLGHELTTLLPWR